MRVGQKLILREFMFGKSITTMESLNKEHFRAAPFVLCKEVFVFFGRLKCIETIGRKYYGTSSCVLCREIVPISERPLSEISLYIQVIADM